MDKKMDGTFSFVFFLCTPVGLTYLSHSISTVAFYNCLLQTVQQKGLPRAIVFFLLPFLTPPSFVNEAPQPGLLLER